MILNQPGTYVSIAHTTYSWTFKSRVATVFSELLIPAFYSWCIFVCDTKISLTLELFSFHCPNLNGHALLGTSIQIWFDSH